MKQNKNQAQRKQERGIGILEVAFLALPLLALTPNNFVPPALSMPGLATQELVLTIYAIALLAVGIWEAFRDKGDLVRIDRLRLLQIGILALFVIWQLVSLLWAPSPWSALRISGIWFLFGTFLFIGLAKIGSRSSVWLSHLLTLVCLILAVTILYERYLYGANLLGFFFNHGISAEILVILLPLQVIRFFKAEKGWQTGLYFVVSTVAILALLIGMRRGALLASLITLALLGLAWGSRMIRAINPWRVASVAGAILILAIVIGMAFRSEIAFRYEGATKLGSTEGGLTSRVQDWIIAREMVKSHPLLGVGQAGFPDLYGRYRGKWSVRPENAKMSSLLGQEDSDEIRPPVVHNEYLETLVELGALGLLLFVAFWLLIGWNLWSHFRRTESYWTTGSLLGLIGLGISSLTSGLSFRYTPGPMILACLIIIGLNATPTGGKPDGERISLPGWSQILFLVLLLVAMVPVVGRAYQVYQSQQLQGQATLNTEPLDFAYYPSNQPGNEALKRRYEEVLRLDPHNSGAHLGYAVLLYQLKENAVALPHARYALESGYSRPFGYVLVAFIQEQLGDIDGAIQTLQDCSNSFRESFFVRASLVEMLRKTGQIERMRQNQTEMYAKNDVMMRSWELMLRANRQTANEEAQRQKLYPASAILENLAVTLVAMRAHHYNPAR